jgi:2'-5' RNA ligase
MRLFVAVDIDAASRREAERLRTHLRVQRPAFERALRWVEPPKLHLTLRFLGEQPSPDPFRRALETPFAQPPFSFVWGAPAWLPPRGRPRVFHVAVGQGGEALARLADEVTARLVPLGVPPEDRPFTAHLTLARVREDAGSSVLVRRDDPILQQPFATGVAVPVDSVVLYQSRLSPRGPEYRVEHRVALR